MWGQKGDSLVQHALLMLRLYGHALRVNILVHRIPKVLNIKIKRKWPGGRQIVMVTISYERCQQKENQEETEDELWEDRDRWRGLVVRQPMQSGYVIRSSFLKGKSYMTVTHILSELEL
jgi:hypothetical protein